MNIDLDFTSIVTLFVVGLGGLVVFFLYVQNLRVALFLVGGMLFFSSIGVQVSAFSETIGNQTWLRPLQEHRTAITAVFGGIMLVGALVHMGQISLKNLSVQGLMYLVMVLYAGFLRMGHETIGSGLASLGLGIVTLVPLLIVVPNLLRGWSDYDTVYRWILYTMLVWGLATLVQVFIDREQLFVSMGGHQRYRFTGLTANPQMAALLLCITGSIGMWLILNGRRGYARLLAYVVTGSILVMLLWTASRTAALMLIIMASAVFYSRLGRAIILLPILALTTYGLWWYATTILDVDLALSHVVSMDDTRSQVWSNMWQTGMDNFLFGVGAGESPATENSLLFGFASYGIGMVLLILATTVISGLQVLQLVRIRRHLGPPQKRLVDIVVGFNAAYFAGAIFEGYLVGRVSAMTVLWFVFGAMAAKIIEHAQVDVALSGQPLSKPIDQQFVGEYNDALTG